MNGSLEHLDQPDPDSIKMFVGQIPRAWSETELKELFEPFGAVHQINILRDRTQNPPQSKGMHYSIFTRAPVSEKPGDSEALCLCIYCLQPVRSDRPREVTVSRGKPRLVFARSTVKALSGDLFFGDFLFIFFIFI